MEAIFISEHLVSVYVCDGRLVDIADWMKQDIFVRLSHDYFTKCQILQPHVLQMSSSTHHNLFPHDVYWCQIYKNTTHALNIDFVLLFFEGLSLVPILPVAPGLPCLCAISPRHPGHRVTTLALAVTGRSQLTGAQAGLARLGCRSCKI